MDISQLTDKMDVFVQSKGWYSQDSLRPQTARNLAISLSLEANEVLEHFQWKADVGDKAAFESELADVCLYLMQLARISGIDLEKAVLNKLSLNSRREWDVNPNGEES